MPIYEYRCKQCDNRFEELVRMSTKETDIVCPHCNKRDCKRLLSTFSGGSSRGSSGSGGGGCVSSGGFS